MRITDNEIIEILQTEKACVTRAMKEDIMRTPTAYDVDAVVKELVEMRNKDSQGCKDVGKKCLSYTDCGLCIMDRAIDIVRGEAE